MRFDSYQGLTMLELGNQMVKKDGKRTPAKKYFTALGFEHTSFDINGRDGAIAIDLSKPVPSKYYGMFDVITNAGTSEHVVPLAGQYECFKNIHECAKHGGIMIHIVPQDGSFTNHSPFCYTQAFFKGLADDNSYTVLEIDAMGRGNDYFVLAALVKSENNAFRTVQAQFADRIVSRPCSRSPAVNGGVLSRLTKAGNAIITACCGTK